MSTPEDFFEYVRKTDQGRRFRKVIIGCRILGLKCDEITIELVERAYKTQLSSPGVHSKLAEEMTVARDNIVDWIRGNPSWQQIPRF